MEARARNVRYSFCVHIYFVPTSHPVRVLKWVTSCVVPRFPHSSERLGIARISLSLSTAPGAETKKRTIMSTSSHFQRHKIKERRWQLHFLIQEYHKKWHFSSSNRKQPSLGKVDTFQLLGPLLKLLFRHHHHHQFHRQRWINIYAFPLVFFRLRSVGWMLLFRIWKSLFNVSLQLEPKFRTLM